MIEQRLGDAGALHEAARRPGGMLKRSAAQPRCDSIAARGHPQNSAALLPLQHERVGLRFQLTSWPRASQWLEFPHQVGWSETGY
jgi:hypothetical protein